MSFLQLRSLFFKNSQPSAIYTRGKYTVLPTIDINLTSLFSTQEYTDISNEDSVYVSQTSDATNTISAFLFKQRLPDNANVGTNATVSVGWLGQSSTAPSSAIVTLEIFNYTTDAWETLDTDNTTAADTDFNLSGETPIGGATINDYFDKNHYASIRLKQVSNTGTLKTDEIDISFIPAVGGASGFFEYDIIRQIPASTSDADEKNDTTLGPVGTVMRAGLIPTDRYDAAFRFENITIPAGSTITAAYLNFYITQHPTADQAFIIKGILQTNTAVWSSGSRPSQRTKTTATVAQTITPNGSGYFKSENITTIVQEIVNQGGWASGNAIAFVLEENNTTQSIRIRDYNFSNLSTLVEVGINYTAGVGGGATTTGVFQTTNQFWGS